MKKPLNSTTVCSVKKSKGLGYFIDLFCAVRIGRKAPLFFNKRGHKMVVFSNDYIGILINQFGVYEIDELSLLFKFLNPIKLTLSTGIALDIGANLGNHSLYFSQYFSKVYAFEPHPDTFYLLKFNAKWKNNIIPNNIGFGDVKGEFELIENNTNSGGAFIAESIDNTLKGTKITIEKLDETTLDLTDLTFMKIDVEGFEKNVIKGGMQVIKKHQPLLVIEQSEDEFINGTTKSLELLKTMGYRFCWQKAQKTSKFWLIRRLINFKRIFIGTDAKIITGHQVPKQFHSMLIAVPPRFLSVLKLD
jgi:FkbM family methyltransferase